MPSEPTTDHPVCPKCGAEGEEGQYGYHIFSCGSVEEFVGLVQTPECRILQLTAERDELARKLMQAVSRLRDCTEGISDQAQQAGRARARAWLSANNDWLAANAPASEGREMRT